jgi:hypothetical protein
MGRWSSRSCRRIWRVELRLTFRSGRLWLRSAYSETFILVPCRNLFIVSLIKIRHYWIQAHCMPRVSQSSGKTTAMLPPSPSLLHSITICILLLFTFYWYSIGILFAFYWHSIGIPLRSIGILILVVTNLSQRSRAQMCQTHTQLRVRNNRGYRS